MDCPLDTCRFPDAWGALFPTYVAFEACFKIDGFSLGSRIQTSGGAGGRSHGIAVLEALQTVIADL